MMPIMGGVSRMRFEAATTAISFDGNSLVDDAYSNLGAQVQALAPINGAVVVKNYGISGQTTLMMSSAAADVDNSFVAGKTNILLVWEITNDIFAGRTGLQACTNMEAYIAARLALHPWVVVLMTCIPRGANLGTTWTATTGEVQLQDANAYLRANYRAMGARALVEMRRAGGPFDFTDSTNAANFPAALWTDRTHPNAAGNAYLAQYIADVLKRLPAR